MLLITGATGNLGKSTIDFLLKELQPEQLSALVRDTSKADVFTSRNVPVRQGDYDDFASLQKAFKGVDELLFISTSVTGEQRNKQHGNVVKAAKEAGVKHVYYTSIVEPSADATFSATSGHFLTEMALEESGMNHTLFRNNLYLDLLPMICGNAADTGTLYFAAGEQRACFVLREDIAEGIARYILSGKKANEALTISSPHAYTFYDVAVALSKAAGKPVKYVPVSTEELKNSMQQAGVPAPVVEITTNMADALQQGEFDYPDTTLAKLLGREPVDLETFIKQFYSM